MLELSAIARAVAAQFAAMCSRVEHTAVAAWPWDGTAGHLQLWQQYWQQQPAAALTLPYMHHRLPCSTHAGSQPAVGSSQAASAVARLCL